MKCSGTITQRVNENLCPNMEYKEKRLIILIVGFFVARLEIRKNFFSHRVIDLWNSLPRDVKNAKNTIQFKQLYDKNH